MGAIATKYHVLLASYFQNKSLYIDEWVKEKPNIRKLIEQPWQWTWAAIQDTETDMWDNIIETLCDLYFIEAKCIAGMYYMLIDDYCNVLNTIPERQFEVSEKLLNKERNIRWIQEIVEYSKKCSLLQNQFTQGKIAKEINLTLPTPPKSYHFSNLNETNRKNKQSKENSFRFNKLINFEQFIKKQSIGLLNYAQHRGFIVQCAINNLEVDEIHKELLKTVSDFKIPYLQHHKSGPIRSIRKYFYKCSFIIPVNDPSIFRVTSGGHQIVTLDNHSICIRDLESGSVVKTLLELGDEEYLKDITPDLQTAITAKDNSLFVWNLNDGVCIHELTGHIDAITIAKITPDGRKAISAGDWYDKTIRVWDIESGQCNHVLRDHTQSIGSICISLDGKYAVVGSWQEIRMYNLDSGWCIHELKALPGFITILYLSSDGKRVLIGCNKVFQLWDLENEQCIRAFTGHNEKISSIDITPDERLAVSTTFRPPTIPVVGPVIDHSNFTTNISEIWLWNLNNGECITKLEGHQNEVLNVRIVPDGRRIITSHIENTIRVWDLEIGEIENRKNETIDSILNISIIKERDLIISCGHDKNIRFWDLNSGQNIGIIEGHTKPVNSLCITPERKRIVSASDDNTIRIWDINSTQCLQIFAVIWNTIIRSICITPDGRRIIAGCEMELIIFDFDNGEYIFNLYGHKGYINSVCVTFDGLFVISASNDNSIRVWNLINGNCDKILEGHSEAVNSICLVPYGNLLVSSSEDQTIRLWDLDSGQCLKIFKGHTSSVRSICTSPNGLYLISVSYDMTLRVWNIMNGTCIGLFLASAPIESVTVCLETNMIICGTITGEIIKLTPQYLDSGPKIQIYKSITFNYEDYLLSVIKDTTKDINTMDFAKTIGHMNALILLLRQNGRKKEALQINCKLNTLLEEKFAAQDTQFALNEFYKDLAVIEKCVLNDSDGLYLNDLADSYENFGNSMLNHNEHNAALLAYKKSLEIIIKALPNDHNTYDEERLCSIYTGIGKAYNMLGEKENALNAYNKSLEILIAYDKHKPGNFFIENDAAINYLNIGDIYMLDKNSICALLAYDNCLRIYEHIIIRKNFRKEWQGFLIQCHINIGKAYLNINNIEKAIEAHMKSLALADDFYNKDPFDEANKRALWIANLTVANTLELANSEKSFQFYEKAGNILIDIKNAGSILSSNDEVLLQKIKARIKE